MRLQNDRIISKYEKQYENISLKESKIIKK
jgi:hypothetical protein